MHNKYLIKRYLSGGSTGGSTAAGATGGVTAAVGGISSPKLLSGMGMIGAAADMASSFLPELSEFSGDAGGTAQALDTAYNGVADAAMAIPPVGTMIGGIMKAGGFITKGLNALGVGTDGMTTADAVLGSPFFALTPWGLINSLGARKSKSFTKDTETFAAMGSSYGGAESAADTAAHKAGKKYGLFSGGARLEANRQITEALQQQTTVKNIKTENDIQEKLAMNMSNTALQAYSNRLQGGYDLGAIHSAKRGARLFSKELIQRARMIAFAANGLKLEEELDVEDEESESTIDNFGWPKHISKDPKFMEFVSTLPENWKEYSEEHEPLYEIWLKSGLPKSYAEANKDAEHPMFIISDDDNLYLNPELDDNDDLSQYEDLKDDTFDLSDFKVLVLDIIDKQNLKKSQSNIDEESDEEDVEAYLKGGQLNIIPEGALHKNKHHLEDINEELDGEITHKGIPVVAIKDDGSIELQAEIENNEIIFNLEVTKLIEELRDLYKDEKSPSKKDEIARKAGEILSNSICEDTDDRTGLLEKIEE